MDDVLCDYSRDARVAHLASVADCSTEHIYASVFHSGFEAEGDAGTMDTAAYLEEFGRRIGYELSLDEWVEARRAGTRARGDVLDMVRRLTVRSAVLTNNSMLVIDHIDRILPELPGVFGGRLFASAGFKAAKPDAACFHRCLDALGALPEETVFFDDLQENVDGAIRAGLRAHQYVSPELLSDTLRGYGVLPS
jgi:putative hydrolase of the HAD superfamily